IWLRPAGGAWALETSVGVAAAVDQPYLLEDLDAGTDYDWALRAVRGGLYRAGYESPDPDTWPAESRSSFTTALLPPTIESATWERTAADSERIRLTITPAHAEADIRVYRDAALIATIPAPGNTESLTFDDTTALGLVSKTNHTYTVRSATAHVESADSAPVTRWVGPDAPENVVVDDGGGQRWYAYRLSWD